jgi:hypothetical protein
MAESVSNLTGIGRNGSIILTGTGRNGTKLQPKKKPLLT